MKKNKSAEEKSQEPKNYYRVPNDYQDALCRIRISGEAGQILRVIERLTLGWNTRKAAITYAEFRKRTGLDDRHILRAINRLLEMCIILTAKKGSERTVYYSIQMDYTKWKPLPKKAVTVQTASTLPKKAVTPLPKKAVTPLPKKAVTNNKVLKTNIKTEYKDSKIDLTLQQLKTREKDLKEDYAKWRKDNPGQTNKLLIDNIAWLDKEIKNHKSGSGDKAPRGSR